MTNPYDILRHEWEEDGFTIAEHTSSPPLDWSIVTKIVIHYPGVERIDNDQSFVDHLQWSQRYYIQSRGYSYGYNAGVWDGVAAEIRGDAFRCAANGNTTVNRDAFAIQIRVAGTGDSSTPASAVDILAVQRIIAWCQEQAGRTLEIVGHRDVRATPCPGDAIYAQIQAGVFRPPEPEIEEPPMPIRLFKFDESRPPLFASGDGVTAFWVSGPQFKRWRELSLIDPANIEILAKAEAARYTFVGSQPPEDDTGIWANSGRA